jgi:toxin YoeB
LAFEELKSWIKRDPKTATRIFGLMEDIRRTPFTGIGKPEPLKHELKGCWSRRINQVDRLVYEVTDEAIRVISCMKHYVR